MKITTVNIIWRTPKQFNSQGYYILLYEWKTSKFTCHRGLHYLLCLKLYNKHKSKKTLSKGTKNYTFYLVYSGKDLVSLFLSQHKQRYVFTCHCSHLKTTYTGPEFWLASLCPWRYNKILSNKKTGNMNGEMTKRLLKKQSRSVKGARVTGNPCEIGLVMTSLTSIVRVTWHCYQWRVKTGTNRFLL